ncbi:hypothetical protein [Glycomyces xiaoerkulensis]|uniref:hypothetical protein n=1 Tax=Glycomyces xiaoerkulensis TaxID=2038139 RepID=UPI000C2622F9|nr:hypothetical protein [Glycomyces xiaoerkulensis]
MNDDEMRERLHMAAEEFRPDADRMWERVAAGAREPSMVKARPIRSRVPHLSIATGLAVVLITAMVSVGYWLEPASEPVPPGEATSSGPGPRPTSEAPTGAESESGPTSEDPSDSATSPEVTPERRQPVDELDCCRIDAYVNDGSNEWWTQTDLVLDSSETITDLTVELHVVQREDLEYFEAWTTADQFFGEPDVFERDGFLVYRWTLLDGEELEPKEYTLAAQFSHGSGSRDSGGDYFVLEAESETGSGSIVGDVRPGQD